MIQFSPTPSAKDSDSAPRPKPKPKAKRHGKPPSKESSGKPDATTAPKLTKTKPGKKPRATPSRKATGKTSRKAGPVPPSKTPPGKKKRPRGKPPKDSAKIPKGLKRPRPPLETKDFFYDSDSASRVVKWFPTFLRHTKGVFAGKPFVPSDWQRERIIEPVFGWKRKADGLRRYKKLWLEVPKKNGKSSLISAMAAYLLFGDREPGAECYSFACDREQARIVFRQAKEMISGSPELSKRSKCYKNEILIPRTNSFYRVMSKVAETSDGINAHGIFFDEIHRQKTRELWDVVEDSISGRTQPLLFVTTTAGDFNPHSIYSELRKHAKRVEAHPELDPSWLSVIYAMEDGEDWTDRKVWARVNPELGKIKTMDFMESAFKKAQISPASEVNFKRLHLNYITQTSTKLVSNVAWERCGENPLDPKDLIGRKCFGGLDLSISGDLTALVLVFPPEPDFGETLWRISPNFYLPQDGIMEKSAGDRVPYWRWAEEKFLTLTPGDGVDYSVLTEDMKAFRTAYRILEVGYDPWNAHGLANQWAFELDLDMVATRAGFQTMNEPTQEFVRLLKMGLLAHGNHPILTTHAANATVEYDRNGSIRPVKESTIDRVDGIVALIYALNRAIMAEKKPKSVYSKRGLRSL